MRRALYAALPCALLCGATTFACSTRNNAGFVDGGSEDSGHDGSTAMDADLVGDGMTAGCIGLQCGWQPCSPMGKPETALTGTVYDPAGKLPLYDAYVYVPSTTPQPIQVGSPKCSACEAVASGHPMIGALTDANGHFTLQWTGGTSWGVPSGSNIPLVIQLGKWRRQVTIPLVAACETNDLDTLLNGGSNKERKLRLPGNGSEGDMPLIAFTSGIDPAECFLRDIGIDDSEFVPPESPIGPMNGHVHFYTAWTSGAGGNGNTPSSSVAGGNTPQETYTWWSSARNLLQYDIIFNACEGLPNDRGASAYGAMDQYLDGGGRLFATHYYYNWFAAPTGPPDLQSVAQWDPSTEAWTTYYVDTSLPKGQAYGQWLLDNGIATGSMATGIQIGLTDTRADVDSAGLPNYGDSTRWIYSAGGPGPGGGPPSPYSTAYLSFNTPTAAKSNDQCGRAVFSDVHLSGTISAGLGFPSECDGVPDPEHAVNEKALEFLFFDLSSCVQSDTMPGQPPPTQ